MRVEVTPGEADRLVTSVQSIQKTLDNANIPITLMLSFESPSEAIIQFDYGDTTPEQLMEAMALCLRGQRHDSITR